MSGLLPESAFQNNVPKPPSTALSLPFPTSFGPPAPASSNLGVPFPVSGGTPIRGPTRFINQSVTQHFVASYDTLSSKDVDSPQERVRNLNVGDLVFARRCHGENRISFPTPPGPTTVELFNVVQLNRWLKERACRECEQPKTTAEFMEMFYFLGCIKNSVDSNISSYDIGKRSTSRMLNLVVSKRVSALNIFPYYVLAGQNLWFIVKKVKMGKCSYVNGKRQKTSESGDAWKWMVIPWTSTERSRPPMSLLKHEVGEEGYGTCIHVGRALETVFDSGNAADIEKPDDVYSLIEKQMERPYQLVRNNLEVLIKT